MTVTVEALRKAAVRRAAAYVHVVGWMPRGIHNATWSAVHDLLDMNKDRTLGDALWVVKPEHVAAIEGEPLVLAVRELQARGFKVGVQGKGTTARAIELTKPGETRLIKAHAYDSGRWSIDFGRGEKGYAAKGKRGAK